MTVMLDTPQRAKGMVHKMVADIAKGCAEAEWEALSSNSNEFYKAWPRVKVFVGHNWRLYVHIARAILAGKLGDPSMSDEEKDLIHGALLLDAAINPKRMAKPEPKRFFLGPT